MLRRFLGAAVLAVTLGACDEPLTAPTRPDRALTLEGPDGRIVFVR